MRCMAEARGGKLYSTGKIFCIDDGTMIVLAGLFIYERGQRFKLDDCFITQRFRTDSVEVKLRN